MGFSKPKMNDLYHKAIMIYMFSKKNSNIAPQRTSLLFLSGLVTNSFPTYSLLFSVFLDET